MHAASQQSNYLLPYLHIMLAIISIPSTYPPHQYQFCLKIYIDRKYLIISLISQNYNMANDLSISFRKVQNLKLKLVKNKFRALPFYDCQDLLERPSGCFKYEHGARGARCQLCPRLKESETSGATTQNCSIR